MLSFKEYIVEEWHRAVMRKSGSVRPGHWNGKKFISDLTKQDAPGFDHERCKSINAQVEVNGKVVAGGIQKPLDEMARPTMLPDRNSSSKVLSATELVAHLGKSRANAVFNHPWHKKHMNYGYNHPNVYKVNMDEHGYPTVMASNGFTFDYKGEKIRRMVKFDMDRTKPKVWNAHLFHNYDDAKHRPEHGGSPVWIWKESHKSDE